MTYWSTFVEAADEDPKIDEVRTRLAAMTTEVEALQNAALNLRRQRETGEGLGPQATITRSNWKLERYQARKKIRMAEAVHRPRSFGDIFRILRAVWREFRTPTVLPEAPSVWQSPKERSVDAIAAAVEAARQITLRNIGGHIVIDFPSLETKSSRDRFREK